MAKIEKIRPRVVKGYPLRPDRVNQKSFYGKAYIWEDENETQYLMSYETVVMSKTKNGELKRHWNGYSRTTGNHVIEFANISKKEWDNMPVNNYIKLIYPIGLTEVN